MTYSLIVSFIFLFSSTFSFGQYLKEQDWAKLSNHIKSNDTKGFEAFLKVKGFSKAEEANEKYTFYNYKNINDFYYGVRANKKSGQVTYMTNDQNYVLKLLSRFISEYTLVKSEKKGTQAITHIFQSQTNTIAIKLDISEGSGTHLLFAVNKS